MARKEWIPQPEEPVEPTDSVQPPEETDVEPASLAPDPPGPRQFSEDEKHRREEIVHDFYVRRRLGKLGLTIAERRARKAMRSPGPRNTGNKQGRSKSVNRPAKNLREEE